MNFKKLDEVIFLNKESTDLLNNLLKAQQTINSLIIFIENVYATV